MALGGLLAAALFLGCASRGRSFDPDRIPHVQRGVTTQAEVHAWFGTPVSTQTWGSGSRWRYFHEERSERDTGMLTKIGRALASWFGWRLFFPPLDVEVSNTVRHQLDVYFDSEGVVREVVYERTELPSKRVY